VGSQCFSFLVTKAHFSSNCASRVRGGKSHEFVVELFGVLTGDDGQTHDRVLMDADQATGLPHPATLLQMTEDGERFVIGQFGTIQRRAFAFREAFLAGATGENAPLFVGTIAETNTQIVEAALAVVGTIGVLATEGSQVIHGVSSRSEVRENLDEQLQLA
jgi:hypothetical protein